MPSSPSSLLALDVGGKRIGIAVASLMARLPRPLTTLDNDENFFATLQDIIKTEDAGVLIVGLPRNLSGQSTQQTEAVEAFVTELRKHCDVPIHMQDEAVTSAQAEAELQKSGKIYSRGDIDALAATYILEDYLREHQGEY